MAVGAAGVAAVSDEGGVTQATNKVSKLTLRQILMAQVFKLEPYPAKWRRRMISVVAVD